MVFLQPVQLPAKCFLGEVLLWAAVQRVPTALYTSAATEWHESDEIDGYAVELDNDFLEESECARVGIPPDPRFTALLAETATLPVEHYDRFLSDPELDEKFRVELEGDREEALSFDRAVEEWQPLYEAAIEYPASRVFVALKEGRLKASGRLLPSTDPEEALDALEAAGHRLADLPIEEIPPAFWTLTGIDWSSSAARGAGRHYCWIRCSTEEVLLSLPTERRPVAGVEQVGDFYHLDASTKGQALSKKQRGRPPFQWEAFHLEVADLLKRDDLPTKKEAAIQYFQNWFERTLGQKVSRAAIGERLKPYYDRFVRLTDKK